MTRIVRRATLFAPKITTLLNNINKNEFYGHGFSVYLEE